MTAQDEIRDTCCHHWHDFGALGGKNVSRCGKCDALAFTGQEPEPIRDIEAIEKRVAEACAMVCDGHSSEGVIARWKAEYFAKEIRNGEWRKYK